MATTAKKTVKKAPSVVEEVFEEPVQYEIMVIIKADITDEEIQKEVGDLKDEIKKLKGEITHEDNWGIRDLAYTIKKQNKGYYEILYVTMNPSAVKEFQTTLQFNQKIIRYGVFKSPKGYTTTPLAEFEIDEEEVKKERAERAKRSSKPRIGGARTVKIGEVEEKPAKEEKDEDPVEDKIEEEEPKKKPVKVKKEEKAEEKEEEVEEVEEEVQPEEDEKEDKKKDDEVTEMSDIDSKLEKILEDPDLNITL